MIPRSTLHIAHPSLVSGTPPMVRPYTSGGWWRCTCARPDRAAKSAWMHPGALGVRRASGRQLRPRQQGPQGADPQTHLCTCQPGRTRAVRPTRHMHRAPAAPQLVHLSTTFTPSTAHIREHTFGTICTASSPQHLSPPRHLLTPWDRTHLVSCSCHDHPFPDGLIAVPQRCGQRLQLRSSHLHESVVVTRHVGCPTLLPVFLDGHNTQCSSPAANHHPASRMLHTNQPP